MVELVYVPTFSTSGFCLVNLILKKGLPWEMVVEGGYEGGVSTCNPAERSMGGTKGLTG